jgi:hypothetical protein
LNYHDAAISDFSVVTDKSRNTVAFTTSDVRTLADEQLGGFGQNFPETRPTWQARGKVQYQWNRHTFKGGLEWTQHEDHRNLNYTGPDLAQIRRSQAATWRSAASRPATSRRRPTGRPASSGRRPRRTSAG